MNRTLAKLLTVPTLIAVILTSTAFGFRPNLYPGTSGMSMRFDDDLHNRTDVASGLSTTTFDTLNGTVTVNLPDDLAAGDTISGTVIAEPKGKTGDEQAKNQDELSGYVVEVAEQPAPSQKVTGNLIDFCKDPIQKKDDHSTTVCSKWSVPDGLPTIAVVLKNREGKIVSHADVPVAPKANPAKVTEGLLTPAVGQAGKPISVKGPFDGDFASTAIKLGNQTAKFLASSPRKVVVESPRDFKGAAEIEVEYKGKSVAKCTYRNVSVNLAAGKLNLIKGEQTTLTVTLAGLIGLLSPVSVQLSNKSPGTVSMGGGETQTIEVNPAQVNVDTFSTKRTLTGVSAGGFSINAVVQNGGFSVCSPGNGGNIPVGPKPQPSPERPNPTMPPDNGGNPRDPNGPPQPTTPRSGRYRVTLNGFTANHVTYRGLFQRPDMVTFFPHIQTFDVVPGVAGDERIIFQGGGTNTIGQTPDNPVQGGSSGANGGFRDGDGFPTQNTPWRRTVPYSHGAPGTIPPTVYFEGQLVQNTHAAIIIPNIWSVNNTNGNLDSNVNMQVSYLHEIIRSRTELRAAVLGMFTHPPDLMLDKFLLPGNQMGIRNTMTVNYGVPQTRPVGVQRIGRDFGFTPQVLVLTYESANYMSRTDFGFGTGIVPVKYVDDPSFAGDYTLYFQIQCAASYDDAGGNCEVGSGGGNAGTPGQAGPTPTPQPTPTPTPTPTPGPATGEAHFQVTINGFRVNHQTLDDALNRDGKGDEVFFLSRWGLTDSDRSSVRLSGLLRSRVMGDATGRSDRVRAGSARPGVLNPGMVGGFLTGDSFPGDPTLAFSGSPTADRAPMLLFDGELRASEVLVVVPTIWEQDGPDDLLTAIGRAFNLVLDNGARSVRPAPEYPGLLGRILATEGNLGSDVQVGLGIFGDPRDRPIGMSLGRESYVFQPQRLRFNFADANEASRTSFGYGNGVIPITYRDASRLQGDYTIFVQIQRR